MTILKALFEKPANLSAASRFTALNGVLYIASGLVLVVWPGIAQSIFMESEFVGREEALLRVIGLTLGVIGWFYFFGGRSGAGQIVAASVVDRLIFVPAVLIPIALMGVFPKLMFAFGLMDPALAIVAWILFRKQ
ncbi:MAG: hypothetical protein JNM27_00295 [Leptospirales bacterium]|nr:hypothetical protein [Leptospirales bacterium]